ncbi:Tol-Pal system protein TolB [Bdellovibrio bacteriovorus]|nr:TolB protein [Bdellovibrio bacteriovorus]BEV69694.1 Tol-Pal system protein TolB [Bdellovibrio bacteriovorus]
MLFRVESFIFSDLLGMEPEYGKKGIFRGKILQRDSKGSDKLCMVLHILYVLAAIFIFTGCSLDANLEDLTSRNQLFIVLDESNKAINSSNIRSYAIKGSCQHVGEPVQITLEGRGTYEGICDASKTFEVVLDLDGLSEGEIQMTVSQNETELKRTSLDTKTVLVDLTPPTVTVNAPDNADNYPASSLRANYPITGACSDALNLVKVVTSLPSEHFLVCSALHQWELRMDLSAQTASSIDFYIQHFDTAGNISETKSVTIRYPQWQKISPDVTSTGYPAVRQIAQYGDSGRVLLSSPLRNDDMVDLGLVNFDGTGLTRINPMSGQWGLDQTSAITPVPKHSRALYVRFTIGRVQLKELHSVKIDGSGDRVLMGPTSVNPTGGVTTYALTPDQNTVIAIGDVGPTDNEFNLYAINVLTGAQTKLNGAMVAGGDVREFRISPDGSTVVFRMDKDIDEAINLYAVNVNGTNLRRLGPAMATNEAVQSDYIISADSKWVVYRENKTFNNVGMALGAVSLVTGEVIDVSATSFNGVSAMAEISPNSRYVAYRIDRGMATCLEMWVYDLQARTDNRVTVPCTATTMDVGSFVWSPDSSKIAFTQAISSYRFDLHIANPDGTGLLRLSTTTVVRNGGHQGIEKNTINFTGNGQKIIWQADVSGISPPAVGEMKYDLLAINADGSGTPVLLTPQAQASVVRNYPVLEVSPSGDRVAYIADLEVDGKYEMYISAVDGSSNRRLSPVISNLDGDVLTGNLQYFFDWDRSTVMMLADDNIEAVNGLYRASLNLAVSSSVKINMPLIRSGDYFFVPPPASGTKVAFRGNPEVDAEMHLYASDPNGSNLVRVTKAYPAGGGKLTTFAFTDDGTKIIYLADQDTSGLQELYVGNSNGAAPVKVSVPITNPNGAITAFKFNEATQKLYYIGDITVDTIPEIHRVNLDGTGAVKITPDFAHPVIYTDWDVAPDGSYIVVRWDYDIDAKWEIGKVAVDGSGTVTRINSVIAAGYDLASFVISPDSQWVCYWGITSVSGVYDVKVASAANPAGVNYMAAQGVDPTRMGSGCRFSEDSEYAVIPGDFVTNGRTSLKTFRLSDQVQFDINPGLPATSHTSLYQTLTEGANKRLITLSESSPDIYELYSMNLDGSDIRKISQNPIAGGQVNANNGTSVKFLNDANKTIVYTGLIETVGKWDLFAVKWDGTESRKLVTLNSFADIYDTFVLELADRVFFRADNDKDGVLSLYSVKGDGTGLKNHMPGLQGNTGVWNSVMATSNRVLFTSDAYNSQVLEVFMDSF